ncbi:toll receptor 13 [Biomphalaria glabrata]|nr:toll receptor 13 [Biomphalaria glabrata]
MVFWIVCFVITICVGRIPAFKPYDTDCVEYKSSALELYETDSIPFDNRYFDEILTYSENEAFVIPQNSELNNSHYDTMSLITLKKGRADSKPTQCSCTLTVCRCSNLRLKEVPQNLPRTMIKLSLDLNLISDLPNCTFCNYSRLVYLDLSSNNLTQLQVGSFWGLLTLSYLNLYGNKLVYLEKTFPIRAFSDLKSLKYLKLNRNSPPMYMVNYTYPDNILSELNNLETLFLDGLDSLYFGVGFRKLSKLRTLVLSGSNEGFCKIYEIPEFAFTNLQQISKLNFSNCFLTEGRLGDNILGPLVNLKDLDISFNFEMGITYALRQLNFIRGYKLQILRMNFVHSRYLPPVTLNKSMIQSLPESLRYLEAQGNNIEFVEEGALGAMPPNVSYIDVGGNIFLYGPYTEELYSLRNLEVLILNGGNYLPKVPKYMPNSLSDHRNSSRKKNIRSSKPFIVTLPPRLLCLGLRFAGLKYRLTELSFNETNSLESLILTNNYLPTLQGPIKGLTKLKKLFVSNCNVDEIDEEMFQYLDELQELRLRNNQLNNFISKTRKPVFQYLKQLKILDLTNNALTVVQSSIFEELGSLEIIDLSRNNMRHFNLSLTNMSSLNFLNLSHTQLSSLSVETRQNIDLLLTNHSVRVDMSRNPIRCECDNVDFLKWMVSSRAFDVNLTDYMCQYKDTSTIVIKDAYEETLVYLAVRCADNSTLFLVVLSVTLCMVSFVVAAVVYRFRWRLRYLYYAAYLVVKGKRKDNLEAELFRYDVFISYASEDEEFILGKLLPEFDSRDLRVLVHGRDFAVGEFIASNIVTAVKESRKTLVVLTRNLLNSTWCNFELQMANMESVHTGRPVLLFLIKESIPTTELTSDLLYHLNKNTYIVYPQEEITDVFWDKLARDLMQL